MLASGRRVRRKHPLLTKVRLSGLGEACSEVMQLHDL